MREGHGKNHGFQVDSIVQPASASSPHRQSDKGYLPQGDGLIVVTALAMEVSVWENHLKWMLKWSNHLYHSATAGTLCIFMPRAAKGIYRVVSVWICPS